MARAYYIGMDVHKKETEFAVVTQTGSISRRVRCRTAIPELRAVIDQVPRQRHAVIEEGPLADWLLRNLQGQVDDFVVCDPRRNSLIAKDSDKDDPIDAEKLAQLYRGGYVRPVHHSEELARTCFKERVGVYHDRVRNRVRQANRIISQFARHGVLLDEAGFSDSDERRMSLRQLRGRRSVREDIQLLLVGYDVAVEQQDQMQRRLVREARKVEPIRRFMGLPGIGWIRASTFYAYVDTPWRFKKKSALWKYMGIGLERRTSGSGPVCLQVARHANRRLKDMILGAAGSAIRSGNDNPFAQQYRRHMHEGLSPQNARRNVARSQAAVLWGMWKSGDVYRPEWVGVAVASKETGCGS